MAPARSSLENMFDGQTLTHMTIFWNGQKTCARLLITDWYCIAKRYEHCSCLMSCILFVGPLSAPRYNIKVQVPNEQMRLLPLALMPLSYMHIKTHKA